MVDDLFERHTGIGVALCHHPRVAEEQLREVPQPTARQSNRVESLQHQAAEVTRGIREYRGRQQHQQHNNQNILQCVSPPFHPLGGSGFHVPRSPGAPRWATRNIRCRISGNTVSERKEPEPLPVMMAGKVLPLSVVKKTNIMVSPCKCDVAVPRERTP